MDLQDYRLLSTSPCINAGNPDPLFNDIDGTRNDIGAYGGPDPIQSGLSFQLTKSISVSNLSGYPGDTISVFISLDNANTLTKADFIINVDNSILAYVNSLLTNATQNFQLNSQLISESEIQFSLSSAVGVKADSKDILEVKYLVNKNLFTGDASSISLKDIYLFDTNLREIFIRSVTNGAFIVNNINESENYLYVDSKSSDSGIGSRQNPFNAIMKAMDSALPGDTIFVSGGNYFESIIMKEGISLIGSGASVTNLFVSEDEIAVVFNNVENSELSGFAIKGDEDHYGVIPLLTIENSSPIIKKNKFEVALYNDFGINCWNSDAVIENNYLKGVGIDVSGSNPLIKNNVINSSMFNAISISDGSAAIISGNTIEGSYGSAVVGISRSKPLLKNNIIYANDGGFGIFLSDADSVKIYNNIVKDMSNSGTGIRLMTSSNIEVVNNTFVMHGTGIEESSGNSSIFNNIVINSNNFGLQPSSSSNYDYNDVWNNFINYNGIDPGINDISSDPLFMDTAKGDYRLSLNSPCRNAGNPGIEHNDIDGSRNDIGAYGGPYADSSWIYPNGSSLAIDSISASLVDTIHVSITGESLKGIAEATMTLSFDPSILNVFEATSGDLTKSFSLEKTNLESGSINLSLKSSKGIIEENGELIKLQMAINANESISTFLHFDSAIVRDESTCLGKILSLKDGQIKITTDLDNNYSDGIPKSYSLYQNYPNPFNPVTTIRYELPKESDVKLVIYNLLGEKVDELVNSFQKAGRYEVKWNAYSFASAVYFYTIKAGDFYSSKKIILLK
jgi:parallel beta-helix repeat protein